MKNIEVYEKYIYLSLLHHDTLYKNSKLIIKPDIIVLIAIHV